MQASGNFQIHSRVTVGSRVLRIQQRLGNGAFGVVYKVIDETSNVYALKDVVCLNGSDIRNAIREVRTMNQISHENVISVIAAEQFRDARGLHMLILTEYCVGGTLNERLTSPSSDEINFKWIHQIAAALAFLHSKRVVHRDLKADNVLLTATEDVKLADFGLAREYFALKRINAFREHGGSWMPAYIQYYMDANVGPIHWVAPECFSGRYTEKADVFSLGTLFFAILERDFVMINGKPMYGAFKRIPGKGEVGIGDAMANYDPNITIQFSPRAQGSGALQRIAIDAMQYNKSDRPSAEEIHKRITNIQESVRLSFSWDQQTQRAGCSC